MKVARGEKESGRLRIHDVTLGAGAVVLRPLTEGDWELVVGLWNDPEVASYSDANEGEYSLGAGAEDHAQHLSQRLLFRYRV